MKNYELRITNENEQTVENNQEPLEILICDDDPADRKLVRAYLQQGEESDKFKLLEAGRADEIQDALGSGGIDIILLDILMPEKSGMVWLKEIVKKKIAPVIMFTGASSEEMAVQALHEGAIDYIPKSRLTADRLLGTIKATLEVWKRQRAEDEKRRLMEDLERFVYTISHDLRAPLFSIQGFVTIVREDIESGESEKVKSDLDYIEKAAKKMSNLLEDTLELSRVGRVANPPEDVPYKEIVQEALEQEAAKIKSNNIEVSVADDFPIVHVDCMRIVEVLVNLIENCVNYMGEQRNPKIDIGYRIEEGETVFFVWDNGIGIDPSQHEKVFGLFYQIEKNDRGTGLGLAIIKRIIEVHSGRVWIESEKSKGCTVCFTLPCVRHSKRL